MLSSFFALTGEQKKWFIYAWIKFLLWDWRIRHQSYKKWQHRVFSVSEVAPKPVPDGLISVIEKAGRHHIRHMNCLRRCMVTMDIMQRQGISPQLHFGVRRAGTKTQAHCWLTLDDKLLNDGPEVIDTYTELHTKKGDTSVLSAFVQ
ncbi:lasso peptide biosynthesis B2 protein [Alteromonas sp. C1M14]|uniref:lasso peptide biosynthesis B2 protein n=1 Tax=Alteromonas sp. C1M14 TaxID=2841567 RepID=UPI001C09A977|nr:lasso peptide biosynthesis B2 protein [Alteromonas sp. C1M14]MBU2977716.1 lasso peptide biosynthesis B2 protein [Alteromonas sp. C1M14]